MIDLDEEPTFEEYVAARKVVLHEYHRLRQSGRFGSLSIGSDEMVSNIIFKSCERFRPNTKSAIEVTNPGPTHTIRRRSRSVGNNGKRAAADQGSQELVRSTTD
jgi:hypothetical protein